MSRKRDFQLSLLDIFPGEEMKSMVEPDITKSFCDAKFMSAEEKKKIYECFKKVIDKRDINLLDKRTYTYIHTDHGNFIAHYNIHGFKHEYGGVNFLRFVENIANPPWYLCNSKDDYSDLREAMRNYVLPQLEDIRREIQELEKLRDIVIIKTLVAKHNLTINQGDGLDWEKIK